MEQQRKGRRARLTALAAAISAASAPAVAADFQVTTTAPTGPGSLAQAITDANYSDNSLNEGSVPDTITITTGGTLSLAGYGLPAITEAVTISGTGNFTINAAEGNEESVFRFSTGEGQGSSLSGLRITNAGYGALDVYSESIVTASDIVISNSGYAENPTEGALVEVRNSSDLTVQDSTFSGNLTDDGVFRVDYASLTIEDSVLKDNDGAAVVVENEGSADIIRSQVTGNYHSEDGGAVAVSGSSDLYVEASVFKGNITDNDGGAISIKDGSEGEIRDTLFDRNISFDEGGALYVDDGAEVSVYDSIFSNNRVAAEPEGEEPLSAIGRASLEGVSEEGGAVFVGSSDLSVYRSTISGNSAARGGGIYGEYSTIELFDTVIKNNRAVDGGGIYVNGEGSLRLEGSTLTGNTAEEDGGGVYIDYASLSLFESTVRNNSAKGDGGGIYSSENTLTIYDSNIAGNSAEDGGGISGDNLYSLNMLRSSVSGNTAEDGGGLDIDLYYDDGYLSIRESAIADNRASDGEAVEIDLSGFNTGFIVGSTISGNVGNDGPAVDLYAGYLSTLNVNNSTFSGNRGNGSRVAISSFVYDLNIRNVTFVDNAGQGNSTAQIHISGTSEYASNVELQNSILSSGNDQEVILGGSYLDAGGEIYGDPSVYAELTANIMEAGFVVASEGVSTGGSFGAIPTDPELGPLADNGGATLTHAPTSASAPGIGQGFFSRPDGEDQRGADTVGDADLGAVEYTDNTPPRLVSNLTGSLAGVVGKEVGPLVVLDYFVDDEGDDISVNNVIGLPAGLSYDEGEGCEGAICGELTAAGEYPVSITVSDDGEPSLSRTVAATVKVRESAPAVFFIDDDDSSGSVPLAGLSLLGALAWLRRRRY